jgi:hypothetical protein
MRSKLEFLEEDSRRILVYLVAVMKIKDRSEYEANLSREAAYCQSTCNGGCVLPRVQRLNFVIEIDMTRIMEIARWGKVRSMLSDGCFQYENSAQADSNQYGLVSLHVFALAL